MTIPMLKEIEQFKQDIELNLEDDATKAQILAGLSVLFSFLSLGLANLYTNRDRYSLFATTTRTRAESETLKNALINGNEGDCLYNQINSIAVG